jgi:hypothetical protein
MLSVSTQLLCPRLTAPLTWELGSTKITSKINLSKRMTGLAPRLSIQTFKQMALLLYQTPVSHQLSDPDSELLEPEAAQTTTDNASSRSTINLSPRPPIIKSYLQTMWATQWFTRALNSGSTFGTFPGQQQSTKHGETTCKASQLQLCRPSPSTLWPILRLTTSKAASAPMLILNLHLRWMCYSEYHYPD